MTESVLSMSGVDVADRLLLVRDGQIRLAGAIDDVTDEHFVLVGSGDPAAVATNGSIVAEITGAGGTTYVARGQRPSATPGWQVDDASLDDVVLAYLTARSAS
ncbi:MAG: hypothetical protein WBQ44_18775 [Rhodococcus sp. (in: high G+C Gram-positive bacteria)]